MEVWIISTHEGAYYIHYWKVEAAEEMKEHTWRQWMKYCIPWSSRNRWQLIGVSSVMFHIVDQAISMTSSQRFLSSLNWIRFIIVCKTSSKRLQRVQSKIKEGITESNAKWKLDGKLHVSKISKIIVCLPLMNWLNIAQWPDDST